MKYYQYITKYKMTPDVELWVCEICRKKNSNLILEGKWRLIGRQETGHRVCNECLKDKHEASGSGKLNISPNHVPRGNTPKAPETKG